MWPDPKKDSTMLAFASPSFSAALLALLPKCPACLVLLLAPLGISLHAANEVLTGAVLLATAIPLWMLRSKACRRCAIRPCCLAILGVALMLAGRFTAAGTPLLFAGAAVMSGSVLWVSRQRHARAN